MLIPLVVSYPKLLQTHLKHKLLLQARLSLLCLHFLAGCVFVSKNPDQPQEHTLQKQRERKLKQYINSHLSKAANIAFSKNGLVYFTELGAEETVKKHPKADIEKIMNEMEKMGF